MRKRLRKKKRVGEFQELGFRAGFRFSADLSNEERNNIIDHFHENAIDVNGLQFGGGGLGPEWDGFVMLDKPRGSATEAHRKAVEDWFIQEDLVLEYYVGPLVDGWYGSFDENHTAGWKKK